MHRRGFLSRIVGFIAAPVVAKSSPAVMPPSQADALLRFARAASLKPAMLDRIYPAFMPDGHLLQIRVPGELLADSTFDVDAYVTEKQREMFNRYPAGMRFEAAWRPEEESLWSIDGPPRTFGKPARRPFPEWLAAMRERGIDA